jgi:hypothetical protein
MRKSLKILIPLLVVLTIGVLVIGALGYILFLRNANETEIVFAPTEIGTPVGDKVTKDIGSAGGTLASPDGRFTLTVPQNALTETVAFSIQPVTNKFGGGLGLAYRLEPDGKTFDTPLQISFRYDDHDLEGTFPEALSLAYQDDKGAWHMQKAIYLDKDKKTIAVSTTHFSIWSWDSTLKLLPSKATVRVGERVSLSLTDCNEGLISGFIDKLLLHHGRDCGPGWGHLTSWKVLGEGTLSGAWPVIIYTAPGKKPTPNVVTVVVTNREFSHEVEVPCLTPMVGLKCLHEVYEYKSVESVITIVDRGYKATGSDGPTTYSGTICSLDKEFTVIGHNGPLDLTFKFTPSGDGRAGTGTLGGSVSVAIWTGNGPYTIEGFDSEKPKIVWVTDQSVSALASGRGTFHIDLVPLDTDECSKK